MAFQCGAVSTKFFQWYPSVHWVNQWHSSGIPVYTGPASVHWLRVRDVTNAGMYKCHTSHLSVDQGRGETKEDDSKSISLFNHHSFILGKFPLDAVLMRHFKRQGIVSVGYCLHAIISIEYYSQFLNFQWILLPQDNLHWKLFSWQNVHWIVIHRKFPSETAWGSFHCILDIDLLKNVHWINPVWLIISKCCLNMISCHMSNKSSSKPITWLADKYRLTLRRVEHIYFL